MSVGLRHLLIGLEVGEKLPEDILEGGEGEGGREGGRGEGGREGEKGKEEREREREREWEWEFTAFISHTRVPCWLQN